MVLLVTLEPQGGCSGWRMNPPDSRERGCQSLRQKLWLSWEPLKLPWGIILEGVPPGSPSAEGNGEVREMICSSQGTPQIREFPGWSRVNDL